MVVLGVAKASVVWSSFSSDSVLLMGGMLVSDTSFFASGAAEIMAERINKLTKGNPQKGISLIFISAFSLSAFLNNTTVVILFLPIIIGIVIKEKNDKIFEEKYVQALSIMSSLGGLMTLVGSGVNVTASGLLESYGYKGFDFFAFSKISLLLFATALLYIYTLGNKISEDIHKHSLGRSELIKEFINESQSKACNFKHSDTNKKKIITNYVIMFLTAAALITKGKHGINIGTIGICSALACIMTGCVSLNEALKKVNWSTILFLGGTIGCANALAASGGGELLALWIQKLFGDNIDIKTGFYIFTIASAIISQFMSNTGTVGILLPVAIPLAASMNASPYPFVIGITVAASCSFMTPMASHVQALIMDWGSYRFKDYIKYSGPITLLLLFLILLFVPVFYPF